MELDAGAGYGGRSSHDLTVAAVDAAGNEGPQVSGTDDDGWSFTVDTTAPDIDAFTDSSITLTDDVGPVRARSPTVQRLMMHARPTAVA